MRYSSSRACKPEYKLELSHVYVCVYYCVKVNVMINANKFEEMKQCENWLKCICNMNEAI